MVRRWLVDAKSGQPWRWTLGGVALVLVIGAIDAQLSLELTTAFFYLIPVSMVAWFAGGRRALAVAVLSAATWLVAEHIAGVDWKHPWIVVWNSVIRLAVFVVVTGLLTALRAALRDANAKSRQDHLTGAINGRWLTQIAEQELYRVGRSGKSLSLAYIDLDGFKLVNDKRGHARGDALLCEIVHAIRQSLRRSDLIARVGGDEFVCLLLEADERAACEVMDRIRLAMARDMQQQGFSVTLSIGIVATADAGISVDRLLRKADELMYTVKHGRKNGIASTTVTATG